MGRRCALWLLEWIRYWLVFFLFRRKVVVIDGKRYLSEPLTRAEKATVYTLQFVVLGAIAAVTILCFIGLLKLF